MNTYEKFEEIKDVINKEDLIEFIEYALKGNDINEIINDFIEATFDFEENENENN